MLSNSNDTKLQKKGVSDEAIVFYQLWTELLHHKTIDIYQYRVHNTYSALFELRDVIDKTLDGDITSDAHIDNCRNELLYLLNNDHTLKTHYRPLLNQLLNIMGKPTKDSYAKHRLLTRANYAIHSLTPHYQEHALADLQSAILGKQIREMIDLTKTVISQALFQGWSTKGLYDLTVHFHTYKPFNNQWTDFEEALTHGNTDFDVLIHVPLKPTELDVPKRLAAFKLQIRSAAEICSDHPEITDLKNNLNADTSYFCVPLQMPDAYAASHKALGTIARALNFVSFYNLMDAWNIKGVNIVCIDKQTHEFKTIPAEQLYSTYKYIDSSGKIFDMTLQLFAINNATITGKLQGTFSYVNISNASLFQEEKFMNLWIALESLTRTKMYGNIIDNVRESVPAAMSIRYLYRITRNFIEDCKRCNVPFFRSYAIESDNKQLLAAKALELIQDNGHFTELSDQCFSVNTLLGHRAQEIHKIVTDIKEAKKKIEHHYEHISWQVQRLYRIRNEIAHTAFQEGTSLIVYITHLYQYLTTLISEIVIYLDEKHINTIEEALSLIRDNYDVFIDLTRNDPDLVQETLMHTGIIDFIHP